MVKDKIIDSIIEESLVERYNNKTCIKDKKVAKTFNINVAIL